jgi:transposase
MIDYETWIKIDHLYRDGLNANQIARQLGLNAKTVRRWLKKNKYQPRLQPKIPGILDPYKPLIVRWITLYPYSARQVFEKLKLKGYPGGYTVVKEFVRLTRPKPSQSFLTLKFEPGECAQVDWGSYGAIQVGNTTRRLSFFVMVLCYSRKLYVEFTLAEKMEHFLQCHRNAFDYFHGSVDRVMVDNCKVAVLQHQRYQEPQFNPRYLDFANHYGFKIVACGVAKPHEKGRVENAVGYVKKNFLAGHQFSDFSQLNPAAKLWLETVANQREHGSTKRKPEEMFAEEKGRLKPLPTIGYDTSVIETLRASPTFRIRLDSNLYSVPFRFASKLLQVKKYPDRLCVYHDERLIALHRRSYERYQDYENPDHVLPLLKQRRQAAAQKLLIRFLAICPEAATYYKELQLARMNAMHHVRQILALSEHYPVTELQRAIKDALFFKAFDSQYVLNILQQRQRALPEPGALHLTRREDLLDLDLPAPDLSIYDQDDLNFDDIH